MDEPVLVPLLPGFEHPLVKMKNIYILDAVSFLFRSYYAIRNMTNKRGESTGALYGFIRSVQKIVKDFQPDHLVAVFDGPQNKQARVAMYEHYKSNRKGMPEDLGPQLELALRFCEYAGIPYLSEAGVEADDLIGAITKWAERGESDVFICSSDKDLAQLVSNRVSMIHTHKENLIIDRDQVEKIYGVKPEQIVDYLAIMGDTSDNIPGIPGFGPKTASSLLQEYGTLENLLRNLDTMTNKKRADKIREHEEDARLSQQLAMLILDVPYPKDVNYYKLKNPDLETLTALYQDMNFSTLLKELGEETSIANVPNDEKNEYQIIDDLAALELLMTQLSKEKTIVFDTETCELQPMKARLVGIGFCTTAGKAWYVPTNGQLGLETVLEKVRPLFENPEIGFIGHNIKYDLHILLNHGIEVPTIAFDTMLASYLLNPQNNRHGLDHLSLEKFGKVKTPIKDLIGTGKKQKSMVDVPIEEVGPYCCEDVDYTFRLKELFEKEIKQESLAPVLFDIELPLIPVLISMERAGMYIDASKLREMSDDLTQKIEKIEKEIYDLAGESFNIKSPKQLSEILFDKLQINIGQKKRSTRAEVLESLKQEYPIASKILEFRGLEKLRSTYADTLPLQVYEKTKRIHCTFMQTVTATGRLSCQDPNLQNIPIRSEEGRKIRAAFRPDPECLRYLSADYSQIELRLLAHMSQDPKLIQAFQSDEDIHASTAATVFDVPLSQVTKEMRSQAKAVNFGIIYGQQAFGLAQELGIDLKEASSFIKRYFEKYPQVKAFLDTCKDKTRKTGMATTMMGRRRMIPEIHSTNGMIRAAAERLAVNTPLQGSQADIIKIAMIKLHEELKNDTQVHMVLQIHDELIFELPEDRIEKVQPLVHDIMENIIQLSIPLRVNIEIGKNWGEC